MAEGVIWLEQSISGWLKRPEIGWVGYKMGTKLVVHTANQSTHKTDALFVSASNTGEELRH